MKTHSEKLIVWATRASVLAAIGLLSMKFYAWIVTGSMGVLASLVDSLLDLCASVVNLLAVRYAMAPPDKEHRFGHGKAEALAGLGQAIFIASSAVFLIIYTVERLINPRLIEAPEVGSIVIVISIFVTFLLVSFQRYVVRATKSVAIQADSLHYAADFLSNIGILVGLGLYYLGWLYADPVIALLIGLYIFKSAIDIAYQSIQLLLDRELPAEEQQKILDTVLQHPFVIELHDLRTRQAGQTRFIQFHVVLNGEISLVKAHELSDAVKASVVEVFPGADVLIHQDPHTKREFTDQSTLVNEE
jgi:ferrous-iron efflux pump FieF